ncbi:acetyl-CoA carboxylase carboxyltransferase subunit alpha [Clostridium sporogenes]|uniref:Acetyl-coenzyme A carboxylase carboxyl transferase subunit alpha n=1 Tax=Clostridium botulinum TaxID=1491 RepID=A0A6M0T2E7_CLOBO|nr:acetyl-CoA carboxylase carboxyltransferase subunit alpha [Clostridium sporogenes]NFA61967.1 acetyl-CoA carboxylase carboxyltransferase subunit alpha [Clostridium botulinum]NFI75102.1 acetyl-CoA carboxylase carboxyltransferase subunit alpha [Clostridium sporogenes]NFL72038.1 acetyl-CoA carboxylase carboxyltransferase subunit alpha [Clostridium sporogenes]NFM25070.1 acetyl-CoA carboxylase carboxyltransferase subunit alpha [Clostridium sporogenes]NFP63295.1 acetyl-CoA carboxylase carboxyltrans
MEDKNLIYNVKKYPSKNAWQRVTLARLKERPTALDYINIIFDDFIELHGDRSFSDDQSIVCGIGLLNNKSVTIVAQQKGKNTKDNIKRNFGMPKPEGYRKALRIMKQAEKFKRPIICFIDTPGAFCGIDAEERGQGEAIARNLLEMSRLKTITLSIVIGEGGSGGALALGVADRVMMLENSVYSILSPEGFASILWKDASKAKEAAEVMKITAEDLKEFNVIDKILKEPSGGAHKNLNKMAEILKENIINEIEILRKYPLDIILDKRYDKFRNMGVFSE